MLLSGYIPRHLRPNLRKYKYQGSDKSLLSKYVLNPFWNKLVLLFPTWMAPNMITTIGFAFIIVNVLLTMALSPNMDKPLPSWCYYLFGFGLFAYQSLDAVDGKQARRTGQSGPLGQMFDHALGNFYLTTWEEFHTSVLYLGYFSGPVEGIVLLVLALLMTGYFGPALWQQNWKSFVPISAVKALPDAPLCEVFVLAGLLMIMLNVYESVRNVAVGRRKAKKSVMAAAAGLFPYLGWWALIAGWVALSPNILQHHLLPLLLYIAFSFGLVVGRMILAHMTHDKFPYFNVMFLIPLFGFVNGAIEAAGYGCTVAFAAYAHFAVAVINDVCEEMDIWCLTIKHPKKTE
ncbi:hypothetical protein RI367_004387 [Sorochytrium milnesiophthora]